MRTKSIFFSLSFLLFLASGPLAARHATKETRETISCEKPVGAATTICFKNKSGPLKVETWDKNVVKVDITVNIEGEEDQVQKALELIKKLSFVQNGDSVIFNTRFWKSISSSTQVTIFNLHVAGNHFKMTLDNCEVITLKRLDLSFVLTIPAGNPLALTQAYEDAVLPDLMGKVSLDLYECNLVAGKLPDCRQIKAKYGKTEIESVGDVNLNLYENKLSLTHAGNVTMISKYTETRITEAGALDIDSYEDKITIKKHEDLTIKAKYTTLALADFGKGTFDLYECTLKAENANIAAISAKYSSLVFISCNAVVFSSSYENKFTAEQAGDFKAASKYSSYTIARLNGSLIFTNSYEDKMTVIRVDRKFSGISVNCKYSNCDLRFEPGTAYQLDTDLKYTSLDFPESSFRRTLYVKEDNIFKYQGTTTGADENTVAKVKFQMYEGGITLN